MRRYWAAIWVVFLGMATTAGAVETPAVETPVSERATPSPEASLAEQGLPPEFMWANVITTLDRDRLARVEEAIALGNEESYATPVTIRARAALHKVMDAPTMPVDDASLLGWWECRTIKVGGGFAGLIVYSWFDCKVSVRNGFLFFEKRSGSQRLSGRLYQDGPLRRILLGAPTYNDEPQRTYSGPQGGITDPQHQDKPGILHQLEDGRLRIVFPLPVLESTYDVLELRRPAG